MTSKEIIFTGNIYCYISPPSTTSQGATTSNSNISGATFGPHHRRNVRNKLYKRKKKQEAKNRKGGEGGVVVKAEVEHEKLRAALEKALKAATREKKVGKTMATGGESTLLLSGSIKKEEVKESVSVSVSGAKTLQADKPQYVVKSPPALAANPFKIDNRKQAQKNWAKKMAAEKEEEEEEETEEKAKRAKRAKRFFSTSNYHGKHGQEQADEQVLHSDWHH